MTVNVVGAPGAPGLAGLFSITALGENTMTLGVPVPLGGIDAFRPAPAVGVNLAPSAVGSRRTSNREMTLLCGRQVLTWS